MHLISRFHQQEFNFIINPTESQYCSQIKQIDQLNLLRKIYNSHFFAVDVQFFTNNGNVCKQENHTKACKKVELKTLKLNKSDHQNAISIRRTKGKEAILLGLVNLSLKKI